jgi:hypothetical protein
MQFNVHHLLLSPLDLFPDQLPIPQLAGVHLEIKHYHAVLPALERQIFRDAPIFKLDDDIIANVKIFLVED